MEISFQWHFSSLKHAVVASEIALAWGEVKPHSKGDIVIALCYRMKNIETSCGTFVNNPA